MFPTQHREATGKNIIRHQVEQERAGAGVWVEHCVTDNTVRIDLEYFLSAVFFGFSSVLLNSPNLEQPTAFLSRRSFNPLSFPRSALLFAGALALAGFSFMAQPLQHLDRFELCPFLLVLLAVRLLMEV